MGRLSPGTMTVAIFAVLVGLGGAFVVRQHLHRPEVPPLPELAPQNVVVPVALTDLEPGRKLARNDIALRSLTPEEYEKSEFAQLAYMRQAPQIVGRTLKTALKQGHAFLPADLYPEGMGPDLAERLKAGYRAVTVPIENIGAVLGFARAGSYVDVLFRVDPIEERPEVTLTLLERVEVLAIDSYTNPGQQVQLEQDGSVTLAVTPHQAKMLKVVEGRGALSLTLRNGSDQFESVPFDLGLNGGFSTPDSQFGPTPVKYVSDRRGVSDLERALGHASERVTLEDLLGLPTKPKKRQIEVYMGSNLEVLEFDEIDPNSPEYILRGGRIQTPIVRQPAVAPDTASINARRSRAITSSAGQ